MQQKTESQSADMRVSSHVIDEIRSRTNIVDIVEQVVRLKKRGRNYQGLCPFHNEKTPSFNVSVDKQIYKCFGCGKGGDVYTFLVEYKKYSFMDSVRELADRLGIRLEFEDANPEKLTEQDELYELNSETGRYFYDLLMKHSDAAFAREYLQKRGIVQKTINMFGLGFALASRTALHDWLKQKNSDISKAKTLGLIGENERGTYDRFAGRLIYPIFSSAGRIAAFAGRILEKRDDIAKYVNSPESPIYTKGKILYGINFTKDDIRNLDTAIIVEGYMDLISLYQHGVRNVVAVSGTSLTEDQAFLLKRYCKKVQLIFDSDNAGVRAAMRSIEILLKLDFDIKIVQLDQGEDPDSYIQKYGKEKFDERVQKAIPFLEFQYATMTAAGQFSDSGNATAAIRELLRPLAGMSDMLKRGLMVQELAKKTGLKESLLDNELRTLAKEAGRVEKLSADRNALFAPPEKTDAAPVELFTQARQDVLYVAETHLIRLLFEGDSNVTGVIAENIMPDEIEDERHRRLAVIVYTEFDDNSDISFQALLAKVEDEDLRNYLTSLTVEQYSVSPRWNADLKSWEDEERHRRSEILLREAFDNIKIFKAAKINHKIEELTQKLETAPDDYAEELYKEIWALNTERKQIEKDFTFGGGV